MENINPQLQRHTHNGIDSQKIPGKSIEKAPQNAVTTPSGGVTIDSQARTAINDIISRLQELGLLK